MAKAYYPHPTILYDNLGTTFGGTRTPKNLEGQKGPQSSRALNERGVGKFCDLEPITGHISETVRDRAKVTINH